MSKSRFILGFLLCLSMGTEGVEKEEGTEHPWRIHTLFSVECNNYFDWQTVGLIHSFKKAKQPGPITRLLSCTEEEKGNYRGMSLAPTLEVPSMSRHPRTGDWYPAINKPAAVLHWLNHSREADNADWVVILDADMIIRGPIIPWEIGAKKGSPVAARYGYLVGCDNVLAQLHTTHPERCDKVGGLLAMHRDDLRELAPWWLSKTEEVREDRAHWGTNITGDIYGQGWISEMYGYSFGAAEVGLKHTITDDLMIYPGYVPAKGTEPILLHYGLPFSVGNWSFSKMDHHEDDIVYDCGRLFPEPPYPRQVKQMEVDEDGLRGIYLSIECVNTLNEALLVRHALDRCAKPERSEYVSFLRSRLPRPSHPSLNGTSRAAGVGGSGEGYPRIHTLFSTECSTYFDWQTVGLMHSFRLSGQPGNITRLLSCTDEDLKHYTGHDLAPTHYVPSMSRHPLTGDWYPGINKPAAVLHWLSHTKVNAEYVVVLDADMILRGPITPWEFGALRGHPVSTPYDYLIGCDNVLAEIHTVNPDACEKVGGVIVMHVDDLRRLALLWVHKTEEVRADKAHYPRRFSGDIYDSGWISEMYGYAFAAAELALRHVVRNDIMIYPGYAPVPGVAYRVFHYGLQFRVGEWSFDKAEWRDVDLVNRCGSRFPDPPHLSSVRAEGEWTKHELSVECVATLNEALRLHHERRECSRSPNLTRSLERTSLIRFGRDPRLARASTLGSLTLWVMVAFCVFSIFGLCTIAFILMPWSRDNLSRVRRYKHRRRPSSLIDRPYTTST